MDNNTPLQTVYLVDDDEALRDSLAWLLESHQLKVETFDTGEAFLAAHQTRGAKMVGCIVLDVRMPGISGLELFDNLLAAHCTLPVIFMTGHGDVPMAVNALKKGAFDFIEKPFAEQALLNLITQCLSKEAAQRQQKQNGAELARRLESLTHREHEVMELIVAGRLNKQIADDLDISIKTVEVHRSRVMEKMEANSLAELVQAVVTLRGNNPNN